ncbi:DUF481 domain-containing protein [Salinimicrobium xinjiangense]|uniref:DUF481 domain-containing protein n=1 Tax=Salinimicrobium xinjiangense TaxID=438596 RepID=UPI00068642F2|nr:DUF481 domain-containing protein [Salinimicrobium xinjiangense]
MSFPAHSQVVDASLPDKDILQDRISVYLDCSVCDNSYLRQEIDFVSHVRDPQLAQVHLFITAQQAASGGRVFTLSFIGKDRFAEINNNLTYTSVPTNTRDEEREGLRAMIELGLVSYLAHTGIAEGIRLEIPGEYSNNVQPTDDPWNNWVFQIYGGANFYEESRKGSLDLRYGAYADYVTADWRIRLRPYFNYNRDDYVRNEEKVRSVRHRNGFEGRAVRSISDHWSMGVFPSAISNTYENIDFGYRIAPAIEYSLLPYRLALRKEYTMAYSIGYLYRDYLEETIYGKMEENLYNQSLKFEVRVLQPWGTVRGGLEGSHYLHDMSKNRISLDTNVSVRIFKGFSVDFSADYDYVQDQLSLPRGDASLEEVLLGQRQLATSYGASLAVGLSYRFGSIYNNVVNTRL